MGSAKPSPLRSPRRPPARYSTRALPRYRHVPGLTPHPVKHPEGHLHGVEEPQPAESCSRLPVAWPECTEYLYGVDLFNRAYLWEAHEAWELVWIAAGKIGEPAGFVQSLIQIAAALLRQHLETPRGARNLLARADRRLDDLHRRLLQEGEEWYCGVSVGSWRRAVADFLDREQAPYPFLILERGESRASSGPGS